jgi:hypothetical protein
MARQKVSAGAPTPDVPAPKDGEGLRRNGDKLEAIPVEEMARLTGAGRRTIKISWGEENYHPVQYNGFKCGGLELVIDVAPNQTIEEAYELGYARLEALAQKQFVNKLEGFIARLREAGQWVKVSAASKGG